MNAKNKTSARNIDRAPQRSAPAPVSDGTNDGDTFGDTFSHIWDINARAIKARIQRHPYGMMAGALGVGFVLGGGVFTPLTGKILGVGLRAGLMIAMPMFQKTLAQILTANMSDTDIKEPNQ